MSADEGRIETIDRPGSLDGLTILRFTHACRAGGGVEQYLEDLNRALLERNSLTVIQLYLPEEGGMSERSIEEIGKGRLVHVPMTARHTDRKVSMGPKTVSAVLRSRLRAVFRDRILYSSLMPVVLRRTVVRNDFRLYDREPTDAGEKARTLFQEFKVSLIVIHLAGGLGSAEVIREARPNGIPYLIFNHFSNEWLNRVGLREQLPGAAGVGGVSSSNVPRHVRRCFTSLLDGIDTDFFSKDNVKVTKKEKDEKSIVLLPSRIALGKGHVDLLKAASKLIVEGVPLRVVFAGREDSKEVTDILRDFISDAKLESFVTYTGHLNPAALRAWYGSAEVVALPSHSEGLGRVLIESQAMEVPVVAYRVGGVAEAMANGKTGYLVKRGDIDQLALRLKELLMDPEKRMMMGRAGRQFVSEHFTHAALAQRHERWYLGSVL